MQPPSGWGGLEPRPRTCMVGRAQARIPAPTSSLQLEPCASHTTGHLLCSSNGRPGLPPGSAYLYPQASIPSSSTSSQTSLGDDGVFTTWHLKRSISEGDSKSSAIGLHIHLSVPGLTWLLVAAVAATHTYPCCQH